MNAILLSPPVAFLVVLAAVFLLYFGTKRLAFRRRGEPRALTSAYTGGERVERSRFQPDYAQFFPFAFFFTILHVVTLTLATVPLVTPGTFVVALLYIAGAIVGLSVLFRR